MSDRGRIQELKQAQEQIVALEMQMASLQRQLHRIAPDGPEDRERNVQRLEPRGEAKRRDAKVQQERNQTINRAGVEAPQAVGDTTLKVSGPSGSNDYLALVRQRISNAWSNPPVDLASPAYAVIIQFRLHRNGSITGVAIEQSSGNEYYDLAGKRAILSASPLPVFPSDITNSYLDAKFTFRSSSGVERLQPRNPDSTFRLAYSDYLNGKYDLAMVGFNAFLRDFGESPLIPDAYYWLGESHYNMKEYGQAIQIYQWLLAVYPQSEKISPALYKLGLAFAETGELHRSRQSFKRLIQDFPSSDEAPLAETRLHEMR